VQTEGWVLPIRKGLWDFESDGNSEDWMQRPSRCRSMLPERKGFKPGCAEVSVTLRFMGILRIA